MKSKDDGILIIAIILEILGLYLLYQYQSGFGAAIAIGGILCNLYYSYISKTKSVIGDIVCEIALVLTIALFVTILLKAV